MKAYVLAEVPDGSALRVAGDDWLGKRGDEAAARVLEVLIGVEGQALPIERVEVERVPVKSSVCRSAASAPRLEKAAARPVAL